jgi:hypothetical protein
MELGEAFRILVKTIQARRGKLPLREDDSFDYRHILQVIDRRLYQEHLSPNAMNEIILRRHLLRCSGKLFMNT